MTKSLREAVVDRAAKLMEKGWCRGVLARDGEGNKVDVYSPEAVEYCIIGAILRATREVVGQTETPTATDILCTVIRNFPRLMKENAADTKADAIAALRNFSEELLSGAA